MSLENKINDYHLILIPGIDGTGKLFTDLIKKIKDENLRYENITVINYQNLIKYDDLVAKIQQQINLIDKKICIIAESFGTPLALMLAAKNKEKVKKIILSSSTISSLKYEGKFILKILYFLINTLNPKSEIVKKITYSNWFLNIITRFFANSNIEKKIEIKEILEEKSFEVLFNRYKQIKDIENNFELEKIVKNIEADVLLLKPMYDQVISSYNTIYLSKFLKNKIIHDIPSSHMLLQTHVNEAFNIIKLHLENKIK